MPPLPTFETPKLHDTAVPTRLGTQLDFILLDGSSSMTGKWWDSLAALQAYVEAVRAGNVASRIIVNQFDSSSLECICRDQPIAEWKNLRDEPFGMLGGSTPLYDAINVMGRKLRDLDPPRASIVIITDGDENGSRFTDVHQAKSILDWCRAKGWQITFIGADFDNAQQGALLGGQKGSVIGVSQKMLADAAKALGEKRARYALYGDTMHYSDEEQQRFGGYLAAPSAPK